MLNLLNHDRSRLIWIKDAGLKINEIAMKIGTHRNTVSSTLKRFASTGSTKERQQARGDWCPRWPRHPTVTSSGSVSNCNIRVKDISRYKWQNIALNCFSPLKSCRHKSKKACHQTHTHCQPQEGQARMVSRTRDMEPQPVETSVFYRWVSVWSPEKTSKTVCLQKSRRKIQPMLYRRKRQACRW